MHRTRLFSLSLLVAFAAASSLVACGGDDSGGGGGGTPDAPVIVDAPAAVDAPASLAGLGQMCNQNMPCPSSAMTCLSTQGATVGFCSLICHAGAQFKTDAQGNIKPPPDSTDTTADNGTCTAAFTGTSGVAACDIPVNVNPTPANPLQKNTTFTYDAYCGIDCGAGNTCPTGYTCNTQFNACELM